MPPKGTIQQDHLPRNRFVLGVAGAPPLTAIAVTGLEQELETAELPDRTAVTGGNRGVFEIEVVMPAHHAVEQAFMESWWELALQPPFVAAYKLPVTLTEFSSTGLQVVSYLLQGVFPKKWAHTDHEMDNEGEDHRITWTLSVDDKDKI